MSEHAFRLDGEDVSLAGADPTESLLRWLRRHARVGTKEGCGDGDCGACTVALRERDADGRATLVAINSCLLPVGALPGRDVITVEALARDGTLHPVQQAMVDAAGSQCGYCTPGFVMSLFVDWHRGPLDDESFAGNLCRCTGYQAIRAATARLAADPARDDAWRPTLGVPIAPLPAAALGTFDNPTTIAAALAAKAARPDAAWLAGATDLGVALSRGQSPAPAYIALDRIAALQAIDVADDAVRIGAGVTLSRLVDTLAGVVPALDAMLPWFAARQVRNRATIGGNLGSASPIGDLLPILLALDATITLASVRGERTVAVDGYFVDYRRTIRADDELVTTVTIPRDAARITGALKVAKRQSDDISIVAAAYALGFDAGRRVTHARLAYGGVAAMPVRAREVEAFLLGRALDEATMREAVARLERAFAPLSDHRASAGYRARLAGALFAKFVATTVAERGR